MSVSKPGGCASTARYSSAQSSMRATSSTMCALLERGGFLDSIGHDCVFEVKDDAIRAIYARLECSRCRTCEVRIFTERLMSPIAGQGWSTILALALLPSCRSRNARAPSASGRSSTQPRSPNARRCSAATVARRSAVE
jgi:hypothetical protein